MMGQSFRMFLNKQLPRLVNEQATAAELYGFYWKLGRSSGTFSTIFMTPSFMSTFIVIATNGALIALSTLFFVAKFVSTEKGNSYRCAI